MAAPTNHWKLGLFVVVGFVLALSTVAVLGARSLRKEVVQYVSYFDESVQGLEAGSPIKFRGVTIGTVGKIDVAPDHRHVEVTSELGVPWTSTTTLPPVCGKAAASPWRVAATGLPSRRTSIGIASGFSLSARWSPSTPFNAASSGVRPKGS